MGKKEPCTFEEWGFQEWQRLKEENEELKADLELVKKINNDYISLYENFTSLVKEALKTLSFQEEKFDGKKSYFKVGTILFDNQYIASVWNDETKYNKLVELLLLLKSVPSREE